MTPFKFAGSISTGTLREQDLIPVYFSTLQELDSDRAAELEAEVTTVLAALEGEADDVDGGELLNTLDEALSAVAPEGYRFGAHEGDGADIGFWEEEVDGVEYQIEALYEHGWEVETAEPTPSEAAETLATYTRNVPGRQHRIRRVEVPDEVTYKIVRKYEHEDLENEVIKRGLTLEEAQAHCSDPETSSRTAVELEGRTRTATVGTWFDAYSAE